MLEKLIMVLIKCFPIMLQFYGDGGINIYHIFHNSPACYFIGQTVFINKTSVYIVLAA